MRSSTLGNPGGLEVEAGLGANTFGGQKLVSIRVQWQSVADTDECTFQVAAFVQAT